MSTKPPWTLQREKILLDSASMIGTLTGFLLILFSENAHSPLCFWLGMAIWVIAIVLAITASLLNPDVQPRWRQRIRGMTITILSLSTIYLIFDAVAVLTHQDLFEWLGFIAMPVVVFPEMFILDRIMRRRMKAQGEDLQASRQ